LGPVDLIRVYNNFKMKKPFLVAVLIYIITPVFTQQNQFGAIDSALIAKPSFHYQEEYTFDKPVYPEKWQTQNGLHVSFASTDEAYFRAEVPSLTQSQNWIATGWKGERLNTMLLVWSADTINQLRITLNDLKSDKGNILNKNSLRVQLVRYIVSNYPYGAREVTCGEGPLDKAYLMPDRLEAFNRFELPGKTVRPIWLSLDIPSNTVAGTYRGEIEIAAETQNQK